MINIYKDADEFWNEALAVALEAKYQSEDDFRLAMSGGSAANLLDFMNGEKFDWLESVLCQVDERFVPNDHDDSNVKLLDVKMKDVDIAKNYFPILDTAAASAKAYQDSLQEDSEGFLFDLTVLGIGPDGHTASLFPHSSALTDSDLVLTAETDVFAVKERLSLSFTAIEKSRKILVLMIGAGKKDIVETLKKPDIEMIDYPAVKILEMPQAQIMWLDA